MEGGVKGRYGSATRSLPAVLAVMLLTLKHNKSQNKTTAMLLMLELNKSHVFVVVVRNKTKAMLLDVHIGPKNRLEIFATFNYQNL